MKPSKVAVTAGPKKAQIQYPYGIIRMYNSEIFALFALFQFDTLLAGKILRILHEFDVRSTGKIKIQDFGNKYGGKQKYTLPVLYLLFFRHYDRVGKETSAFDLMHQSAIVELLASATYDVFAPHFLFLCFLFQFLTIEENDFLEYLFWLLTKGERTLDRGDIAMLLQMVLADKKDAFVTQHKDAIEKIFLDQGSEAIVLNRFQVINASLSGIFTRIIKELQASVLQNLFGAPKLYKDIVEKIAQALYTQQGVAYDRIRFHKQIAANRTTILKKKAVRKEIRVILRLMQSYWHLKQNTTLVFKNNGASFTKMIQTFFEIFSQQKKPSTGAEGGSSSPNRPGSPENRPGSSSSHNHQNNNMTSTSSSLEGLQKAAELAAKKKAKKKKSTNPVLAWIDDNIMHTNAKNKKTSKQLEEEELLKEMAELPDEALDPFKFEEDFAYTLDLTEQELFRETKHTRQNVHRSVLDTEMLLAEIEDEMNMTFASLGLSTRDSERGGGHDHSRSHGFGSFLSNKSGTDNNNSSDNGASEASFRSFRHRGANGSFHLPQQLVDRKARLQMIQETLGDGKGMGKELEDDEEAIMRAVQDLGRRYEEQAARQNPRTHSSRKSHGDNSNKSRRKSSFFQSIAGSFMSKRSLNDDEDLSSDEDMMDQNGHPIHSASSRGKKKNKRVSISDENHQNSTIEEEDDEEEGHENGRGPEVNEDDDHPKSGRSSRRKQSLLSDIEQAKSMEKLSSMLSSNKQKPSSASSSQRQNATQENDTSSKSVVGNSAMSRLNQWKARKQPKADTAIDQESQQIDQLRNMLMVDDPDDDELNAVVNEALTDQFLSDEGLNPLILSANIAAVTGGSAIPLSSTQILAIKDETGKVNLTDEQRFAYDAYNYEQDVHKKMDQEAYLQILKQSKK